MNNKNGTNKMSRVISRGCKQTMFVGDRFLVKDGWCDVVGYNGKSRVTVRFDKTGSESTGTTFEIRNGTITDPLIPSVYGIGFFGKDYKRGQTDKEIYSLWAGVLERCYNQSFKNGHPTYQNCKTTEEWKNFSIFCADIKSMKRLDGWELDKDLLVKGNKIYGREFCVFLPREINIQFSERRKTGYDLPIGVYAKGSRFVTSGNFRGVSRHLGTFDKPEDASACYLDFKSNCLKILAEDYKDVLDSRAYEALINFKTNLKETHE